LDSNLEKSAKLSIIPES
jgi:hypothetical protein